MHEGTRTPAVSLRLTDRCSYNYAGACRFYVGLAKEIKVVDSPEFEEYVKTYVNECLIR